MLKIVTLICALIGLLAAVLLESWLRSRIVRNEASAETYADIRSRNSDFLSIQYAPLAIMLSVMAAVLFAFVGHMNAAAFLGGAVLCFVSIEIGSVTVVTGSMSSLSAALSGDIRNALKTAYRSAAVMGLGVCSIALLGLGGLFFFLKTSTIINIIASFALGASLVSLCIGLSGTAFSGAYALSVKRNDFTDYTGMFIGSGADHVETYILSACSAALLAEVGVETSGVMSTFSLASAAKYPLIVYAAGLAASVIGIMTYRGRMAKDPSSGLTAGNLIAALIVIAVSVYFSISILQSYVYSVCVAIGIAAGLISGELAKGYSNDGIVFRRLLPEKKKFGTSQTMIYSLSIGMISVIVPSVLTTVAIIISYKYASFYGVALAAVGINSIAAVNSAVRGFAINTASASEIASLDERNSASPDPADILLTASSRSNAVGKTYSGVSAYITLVAMYAALSVSADSPAANLLSIPVFTGMTAGAVSVFICAGLIIRSIRLTGIVLRTRLNDKDDPEKRVTSLRGLVPLYLMSVIVPAAVGFTAGISGLMAFSCAASVTGMCVIFAFNDSGSYFDRSATETLGTVIKLMVAVSLVFAPFFMEFGGLL